MEITGNVIVSLEDLNEEQQVTLYGLLEWISLFNEGQTHPLFIRESELASKMLENNRDPDKAWRFSLSVEELKTFRYLLHDLLNDDVERLSDKDNQEEEDYVDSLNKECALLKMLIREFAEGLIDHWDCKGE